MSHQNQASTGELASRLKSMDRRAVEDVLRAMLECEHRRDPATDAHVSALCGLGREDTLRMLARAREAGLAEETAQQAWRLTADGRAVAVRIMRAHRLTETDLARNSSVPAAEWHARAHAAEHALTDAQVDALADALGHPRYDPHGDPIPTREGELPEPEGQPLSSWPEGRHGVITHIEDEPPRLYAQLAARGIFAGMRFTRTARPGGVCRLDIEGATEDLPAELAALIRVRLPLADEGEVPAAACRLTAIAHRGAAEVVTLLPGCIGAERSRLLDLGFVPGSRVERELSSPLHGPVAYRVRGTLIALRPTQAAQILVKPLSA